MVEPGKSVGLTAFIQCSICTATWDVQRVEIEDSYEIRLVLDYDTSVPAPIVRASVSDELPDLSYGESFMFTVVLENIGKIRADEVKIGFPDIDGYVFTPLLNNVSISAMSTLEIPCSVVCSRKPRASSDGGSGGVGSGGGNGSGGGSDGSGSGSGDGGSGSGSSGGDGGSGGSYSAPDYDRNCNYTEDVVYGYVCGMDYKWHRVILNYKLKRDCSSSSYTYNNLSPSIPVVYSHPIVAPTLGGGSSPTTSTTTIGPSVGPTIVVDPPTVRLSKGDCEPYINTLLKALKNNADKEFVNNLLTYTGDYMVKNIVDAILDWLPGVNCGKFVGNALLTLGIGDDSWLVEHLPFVNEDTFESYTERETALEGIVAGVGDGLSCVSKKVKQLLAKGVKSKKIREFLKGIDAFNDEVMEKISDMKDKVDAGMSLYADVILPAITRNNELKELEYYVDQAKSMTHEDLYVATKMLDDTLDLHDMMVGGDQLEYSILKTTAALQVVMNNASARKPGDSNVPFTVPSVLEEAMVPDDIDIDASDAALYRVVARRWNNSINAYLSGEPAPQDGFSVSKVLATMARIQAASRYVEVRGFDELGDMMADAVLKVLLDYKSASDSVCASVSFKLSQTVSMTREAFQGTLTLYNGHATVPMEDIGLNVSVSDADGNNCNSLFGITSGTLVGIEGSSILGGGDCRLVAQAKGTASVLFVPTPDAAPTEPKVYYFGATVNYIDPFTHERVTMELAPVALTVNPCPYIHLDYFVQRDVYSDDPFTTNIVEASMPAELAVLVRNVGYGDAKDVNISSVRPEIVKNDKGLAVLFDLKNYDLSKMTLNGATAYLGLDNVNVGTISALTSSVAQWWLTSSIEGHFVGMSATLTHLNSWGNPDTALVDGQIGVHKLIRSLAVEGETLPWFLTSETGDLYGTPDTVYAPNGSVEPVRHDAVVSVGGALTGVNPTLTVTVTAVGGGWNYVFTRVPGLFNYTVESVMRLDGSQLPLRNAWITDRTFRDGSAPLLEERIHIADYFTLEGTQTYTITLAAKPTDVPEVAAFEGVTGGAIEYAARNTVTVVFSKPIDPATFAVDDLSLIKQGTYLNDLSVLTITAADDSGTRFTIGNLSALCGDYGRYELTIQCAGIADTVGQLGTAGKSVAWTYATAEAPYVVGADGVPVRRVQSLDAISVTFSAPVDPATFTSSAMRLNGVTLGGVTVEPLDASGTRFSVSGLASAQSSDGTYALTVDATAVAGLDGTRGVDAYTATWTRDTTAPVLSDVRREEGLNGTVFVVDMTETAVPDTISLANVMLTRRNATAQLLNAAHGLLGAAPDGETEIAIPVATARVTPVGGGSYEITGLDSVLSEDGVYTLYFDATGIADEAGNVASGSKSVTWTVDRTPPAQIADLVISPDGGFSDTDGITYTGALTVTGTLPEAGLTVEIIAKYVGGGETVLATFDGDGGVFSSNVNLPGSGNVILVVRLTDAAGNSSDTEKNVYVDGIALTGILAGASEDEGVVTSSATLTFSDKVMDGDVALEKFSLTRDGEAVALEGVTFAKVNDTTYTLTGLESLCSEDGVYVLRFDGSAVRKYTSGLMMSGSLVMRWRYENPDREPPTVTAVLFDGDTPHEAYTNVFSSVAVTFSEAVNVPELIEKGLIGKVARIDLLDVENVVTGSAVIVSDATWNGESNTLSWQIDSLSVPAGGARLILDAGLIEDLAGNRLAAGGSQSLATANGMRTYTLSETVLAQVNAQAMPTWYNGELYVGEKTADNKGKIRHYAANGTWSYLQSDGADIEIPAQGCQGASVAFADMDGDGVAETYVGTTGGDVLKYPGGETIASFGANRAMPYAYDMDGDGRDELIAGGMDGRIRVVSHDADAGTYSVALIPDVNGAPLTVPNGRAAPVVADINHDGIADIVSGDTAGNVWAYLGDGYAWCAQPVMVFTNNVSLADRSRLGYGDVDGDGIEDLIVGRSDGSVTVMLGAETPSPIVPFAVKAVVSASAGTHGAIAPVGDATYDGGDTPEYVITPDIGYHVADVLVDGVSIGVTNSYVFAPLATSHTIGVDFAVTPYAITYTGLKGATNPNPATYTVEDALTFAAPGEVYGWVFKGWTPDSIALGSTGAVEVVANWERQKFDVTVNGETRQYSYEDAAVFTTNAVINCGATQYVCKGWVATNARPESGEGTRAAFRVLGDVSLAWLWETNVVTLAQSVNADGLDWTTGGAAGWLPEWSDAANDGVHHAHSGVIGNNTNSWIETTVEGAGTLTFVWKSSTEARYDMLQLIVDGEVKGTISGETSWITNTVSLARGTHVIRWNYRKSRSGTAGEDRVLLDTVTWTAYTLPDVPPTLAEALNPDLFWTTGGDVEWTAVRKDSPVGSRDDWATVGGLADYETSRIETTVYGAGVLTFDWAVSCEDGYDWFDFIADGEIRESITGDADWKTVTVEFKDGGKHILQWEYWKDDMDETELAGDNRARLDNVRWTPLSADSQYTVTTPVPVPFVEIRTAYSNYWVVAKGDYETAAHSMGRNGYAIWKSYVAGLVPDDEKSKFFVRIEMQPDGTPEVTWTPDTPELRATRTYTKYGKKTLLDKDWVPLTDANMKEYNFFKVEVKMK